MQCFSGVKDFTGSWGENQLFFIVSDVGQMKFLRA
jgi:hypothetical protein